MSSPLLAVQLELTNRCPIGEAPGGGCSECAYRFMTRKRGDMPMALAMGIVEDVIDTYGQGIGWNLNGLGEPLAYVHLPTVLATISLKAPQARVELFTSLVGPQSTFDLALDALSYASNPGHVAICIHARKPDGSAIGAMATRLQRAREVMERLRHRSPRFEVHIAQVVTRWTTEEDRLRLRDFFLGGDVPLADGAHLHFVERIDPWNDLVRDQATHPIDGCSDMPDPNYRCNYPYEVLHYGWDGTPLLCCADDVYGLLPIGDRWTRPGDVRRAWEGPALSHIRKFFDRRDVTGLDPCRKCSRAVMFSGYVGQAQAEEART